MRHPSSTTTQRFVLRTDSKMMSSSRGRSVRGSTTSASMPSSASALAAAIAVVTDRLQATMVTSPPARFTSPSPRGMWYSSSGTSPLKL